jgi:hypothetical protein
MSEIRQEDTEAWESRINGMDAQMRDLTARLAALTVAAQDMIAFIDGIHRAVEHCDMPDTIGVVTRARAALATTAAEVRERVKVALLDVQLKGEDPDQGCDRLLTAIVGVRK